MYYITFFILFSTIMKILKYISRILITICIIIALLFARKIYQNYEKKWEVTINLIDKSTVIAQLRMISKLETAEVTITKTLSANTELSDWLEWYDFDNYINDILFHDSMTFSLTWKVVAGINLDKIQEWDIKRHLDGTISIKLPEAEILYVTIDENALPQRQLWLLAGWWNVGMETEIRNHAKEEMKQDSIKAWILDVANEKAYSTLQNLLHNINIELKNDNIEDSIDTEENEFSI